MNLVYGNFRTMPKTASKYTRDFLKFPFSMLAGNLNDRKDRREGKFSRGGGTGRMLSMQKVTVGWLVEPTVAFINRRCLFLYCCKLAKDIFHPLSRDSLREAFSMREICLEAQEA